MDWEIGFGLFIRILNFWSTEMMHLFATPHFQILVTLILKLVAGGRVQGRGERGIGFELFIQIYQYLY